MKRVYLAGPPFADEYRRRAHALLQAAGCEPIDPMRRDFRAGTGGHEDEIVSGDLADIDGSDAVLAAFTAPDEGTAMEAWYAHSRGKPVVVYTGGTPPHPWTVYVASEIHEDLEAAVRASDRGTRLTDVAQISPQKSLPLILAREFAANIATPVIVMDERGRLVFFNEPAERILGQTHAEVGELRAARVDAALRRRAARRYAR